MLFRSLPLLVRHFIERFAAQYRKSIRDITPQAQGLMARYSWPGNVRELRAAIERAIVAARGQGSERVLSEHLEGIELASPICGDRHGGRPLTLLEQERRLVRASLDRNGWCRAAAARELGIARSSLHGKMRKFGLRDQPARALPPVT